MKKLSSNFIIGLLCFGYFIALMIPMLRNIFKENEIRGNKTNSEKWVEEPLMIEKTI